MSLSKNSIILIISIAVLAVAAIVGAVTWELPADGVFHEAAAIQQGHGSTLDADMLDSRHANEVGAPTAIVYHSLGNADLDDWCERLQDGTWMTLWTGYSFQGARMDGGDVLSIDPNLPGSCIEMGTFENAVIHDSFVECRADDVCSYDTDEDFSIWLIAQGSTLAGDTTTRRETVEDDISKCAVCISAEEIEGVVVSRSRTVVTMYSIGTENHGCPAGFTELWDGFGYIGSRMADHDMFDAGFGGTGSCLPNYLPLPFAECNTDGCAHESDGDYGIWLTGTTDTASATDDDNIIGTCVVCASNFE